MIRARDRARSTVGAVRSWCVFCVACIACAAACRRTTAIRDAAAEPDPTAAKEAASTTVGVSSSGEPAPPDDDVRSDAAAPPQGPAPSGAASPEERRRVLGSLLSGAVNARVLPESGTAPGVPFDRRLRRRMTTVEVASGHPPDPLDPDRR